MEEGRGINIKHFGTFTFEPLVSGQGNNKNPRAQSIKLRPCFIVSPELAKHLRPSESKGQLDHHIEGSIYQQGVRVSYLNPVPVAAGCYLAADFVKTAIDTIFKAIADLAMRGFNLELEFDSMCTVTVRDRSLKAVFVASLKSKITQIEQCYPLKSINRSLTALPSPDTAVTNISPVHAIVHAKKPASRLSTLQRPNSSMLKDIKERIEKLNESSKDLCNINCN